RRSGTDLDEQDGTTSEEADRGHKASPHCRASRDPFETLGDTDAVVHGAKQSERFRVSRGAAADVATGDIDVPVMCRNPGELTPIAVVLCERSGFREQLARSRKFP